MASKGASTDQFICEAQSYVAYSEALLRRDADGVRLDRDREVVLRRLLHAGPVGIRALLDASVETRREDVRHLAAEALAKLGASASGLVDLALEAATHPHPTGRVLAVRALGTLVNERATRRHALQRALTDVHPEVREWAAHALTELRDRAALAALRAALTTERAGRVASAIRAAIERLEG